MESVWDYPRPPRVEVSERLVRVEFAGEVIAETTRACRCSRPVTRPSTTSRRRTYAASSCARAGSAPSASSRARPATTTSWPAGARSATPPGTTLSPCARYEAIRDHVAFYPGRVDAAWVDDEQVQAQAGDFYGGWITSEIQGPFKGGPGTAGW